MSENMYYFTKSSYLYSQQIMDMNLHTCIPSRSHSLGQVAALIIPSPSKHGTARFLKLIALLVYSHIFFSFLPSTLIFIYTTTSN